MKTIIFIIGILITVLALAGPSYAEPSFLSLLNLIGGFDNWTMTSYEKLSPVDDDDGGGQVIATMKYEYAGYASGNRVGLYDIYDPNKKLQIFGGSASPGAVQYVTVSGSGGNVFSVGSSSLTFATSSFGLYIHTQAGDMFYSQDALNGGSEQIQIAMLTGEGQEDTAVVGFEDLPFNSSDKDYNDMVITVENVTGEEVPPGQVVPEPATMTLLVFGGLGITIKRFMRKKNRKDRRCGMKARVLLVFSLVVVAMCGVAYGAPSIDLIFSGVVANSGHDTYMYLANLTTSQRTLVYKDVGDRITYVNPTVTLTVGNTYEFQADMDTNNKLPIEYTLFQNDAKNAPLHNPLSQAWVTYTIGSSAPPAIQGDAVPHARCFQFDTYAVAGMKSGDANKLFFNNNIKVIGHDHDFNDNEAVFRATNPVGGDVRAYLSNSSANGGPIQVAVPVPEPATIASLLFAGLGMVLMKRFRRK